MYVGFCKTNEKEVVVIVYDSMYLYIIIRRSILIVCVMKAAFNPAFLYNVTYTYMSFCDNNMDLTKLKTNIIKKK